MNKGTYPNQTTDDTLSMTWRYVPSHKTFIANKGWGSTTTESGLRRGDMVYYDWEGNGSWDHVTVVVIGADEGYPYPIVNSHTNDYCGSAHGQIGRPQCWSSNRPALWILPAGFKQEMVTIKSAYGLLTVYLLLLLAGCFTRQVSPVPVKAGDVTTDYFEELSPEKREKLAAATASQVIALYFEAINKKDYDFALAALSPGMIQQDGAQGYLRGYKEIVRADQLDIQLESQTEFMAEYMVTFNLKVVDDPKGAWGSGTTTWFLTLSRNSGRWCIAQIGTSP